MIKDPIDSVDAAIDSWRSNQISNLKKSGMDFLISLQRPLATLFEAIVRDDLGERYFTKFSYGFGLLIIGFAAIPPGVYINSLTSHAFPFHVEQWGWRGWVNLSVGVIWWLLFALFGSMQLSGVRNRYEKNIFWHSYSNGSSDLDKEISPNAQAVLFLLVGVGSFFAGAYGPGLLMFISGYLSRRTRVIAEKRFYEKVLDALDARIEQENLADAVLKRSSSKETAGYSAPLRASLPQKHREKFIQIVQPHQLQVTSEPSDESTAAA